MYPKDAPFMRDQALTRFFGVSECSESDAKHKGRKEGSHGHLGGPVVTHSLDEWDRPEFTGTLIVAGMTV
jgi:hypothetical protein